MRTYEGIFVFPPILTPEEKKADEKKLEDAVARFGGKILQKIDWGKKSLGYAVKKFRDGYFLILEISMEPAQIAEFRKTIQLMPELIKSMLTVKEVKVVKNVAPKAAPKKVPEAVPVKAPEA